MSSVVDAPRTKRRCRIKRRRDGKQCEAAADIDDCCWVHGSALTGPHALTLEAGQPTLWPCKEDGMPRGKPRYASKWAAVQYILRGFIVHGLFVVDNRDRRELVDKFIRRVERAGARVVEDKTLSLGVLRRVRFEKKESQDESS
jgi:hypothetical protein